MKRNARNLLLTGCSLFLFSLSAHADLITEGFTYAVASGSNQTATGTHFHSNTGGAFGNPAGKAEVGRYFSEEVRGLSEYDLFGLVPASSAFVTFDVFDIEGLFMEYPGTFIGDILIEAYMGNVTEDISDYQAAVFGVVGSFSTSGLIVGDTLSFDITSIFNGAMGSSFASLGIRLRADPLNAEGAFTFDTFRLTTSDDTTSVPEPGTLGLLGLGLLAMAARRRRKV